MTGWGCRLLPSPPPRYIDPAPLGNVVIKDPVTDLKRVFIPSKVDNNYHIDVDEYKQRLRASGSKELVAAWLDGDWSVTMGAFFDCWDTKRHVVQPFQVPSEWMRFRSMDWGSASPFSVGWWAVVQDDFTTDGRTLPRGCLVRYREWYGCKPGQPNVGIKAPAQSVGQGILAREKDDTISYGVLDPSAFAEDGGPSLAERIAEGGENVILFDRGDCRMSTWTEDDKQIAARALKTLEQARVASRGAAIYCLEPVRGEMASKRPDDIPERADAWLAVCSLCEALVEPDSEEPVSKWRDAINKTQAWLDAMR
jgi:hypothetical protein